METFSLEDLKAKGLEVAKRENVSKLIASSDGQFFTEENRSYAKMHARTTKGVELHDLTFDEIEHTITKEDLDNNPDLKGQVEAGDMIGIPATAVKKSAAERIAEIATLETIADVENYVNGETAKTVLAAAEAKKVALKTAEETADAANGRN